MAVWGAKCAFCRTDMKSDDTYSVRFYDEWYNECKNCHVSPRREQVIARWHDRKNYVRRSYV